VKAGEQVEEGEGRMKARERGCTLEAEGISGKEGDRRQNKGDADWRRRMLTEEGEIGRRREKGERRQEKEGADCKRREKEKGEGGKREVIAKRGGMQTGEQGRREKRDKKRRMKTGE
jgi:hypothetical protein